MWQCVCGVENADQVVNCEKCHYNRDYVKQRRAAEEYRRSIKLTPLTPVGANREPQAEDGLKTSEYWFFGVLFLLPFVNILVSSILYYVWRSQKPLRAKQINRLGWIIFGCEALLVRCLRAIA
jgi:hypothetical protein